MVPFAYFGAKHRLAPKYPRPAHPIIVEPFAGSAGYAIHHANTIEHALLIDADPAVVDLWHELQQMTPDDLDTIGRQLERDRFDHPLLAGLVGSTAISGIFAGRDRAVTSRMRRNWPRTRDRIAHALPRLRTWEIRLGTYEDAPDLEATWFVDPPYRPEITTAGDHYRFPASAIDFDALARWCRSRRGLCIVTEQSPADWLPFAPIARHNAAATRMEVAWISTHEQGALW